MMKTDTKQRLSLLDIYNKITLKSEKLFNKLLDYRLSKNKESAQRINERRGIASLPRPENAPLIWVHASSVGEAQSALILINTISQSYPETKFLVTSGTLTSADLMAQRLPDNAFHQFFPLDQPQWVNKFLDYWHPDFILWMESELWPNMLRAIKEREIPATLINARLSNKSFFAWNVFSKTAKEVLSTFSLILTQTKQDEKRFHDLGASNITTTDNIKFSAAPLPIVGADLASLKTYVKDRPTWVFASTHDGEELLACRIHAALYQKIPNLLTIIIPRHPERRKAIKEICELANLKTLFRGSEKKLPQDETQIYVVDTLGELGMFYYLTDIAVIGRSFSNDGGGGHNPIEAAQMNCAVLTGPNVQFQQQLFNEMFAVNAAIQIKDKIELLKAMRALMMDKKLRQDAIDRSTKFATQKTSVINRVMENLNPLLIKALDKGAQ